MSLEQSATFDAWAIVDLFGHQRLAGRVTEATIGGCAFVRLDVPAIDGNEHQRPIAAYTRYFGQGAIYSISPTSEELARRVAAYQRREPVQSFEMIERPRTVPALPPPQCLDDDDDVNDKSERIEDEADYFDSHEEADAYRRAF